MTPLKKVNYLENCNGEKNDIEWKKEESETGIYGRTG